VDHRLHHAEVGPVIASEEEVHEAQDGGDIVVGPQREEVELSLEGLRALRWLPALVVLRLLDDGDAPLQVVDQDLGVQGRDRTQQRLVAGLGEGVQPGVEPSRYGPVSTPGVEVERRDDLLG
jgi:hypothetical protein